MKQIKIIILCLLTIVLFGCSNGKMDTVDMNFESSPEAEIPTISKEVTVHTVVGVGTGEIIAEDKANKWVKADLALVSQHPYALIENSLSKVFKAEVVSYDEEAGVAYLHFKNSTKLNEKIKEQAPKEMKQPITYKERIAIKEKFADSFDVVVAPSEKIEQYEDALFKQNPDEIEAFVYDFENALDELKTGSNVDSFKNFIANDALQKAFESLSENAKQETYANIKVKSINIGEYSTIASADLALSDEEDAKVVKATYSIIKINGDFKIINVQYE